MNIFVIIAKKRWRNLFIPIRAELLFSTNDVPTLPKGFVSFRQIGKFEAGS